MSRVRIALSAAVGAFVAFLCVGALAQESLPDFYKDPGIYPNRDYVNQHVTENVDPFTGSLQIHSTDVYLPGEGGFDLKVIRSFNSTRVNPLNPADFNTSTLAGLGWTIHFGRVIKPRNIQVCVNTDNGTAISDNPVSELPDGSRQVLAFTGFTSPLMMTTQRWKAECINGTGLAVFSPDGVRYDMTQLVTEVGSPNAVYAWYTTKITDRNGNSATVAYAASGSPQISSVTTTDSRSITFGYLDSGLLSRRVQTITVSNGAGTRVWTYSYLAVSGVAGRYFLTQVQRPDAAATSWQYAYNTVVSSDNPNNYQMLRMTYPQGGTVTYGYGHTWFDTTSNPTSRSAVVTAKSSSDGGSWSFKYTPGTSSVYDTTVVSTPAGTITYKHFGANFAASGSVWRIGLLAEKTTGAEQTETLQWGSQIVSNENNARVGAFTSRVDTDVNAPILTQRTINRNGATYASTFSSHDTYGNPGTVVEAGPNGGSRTTNLTYYYNTGLWIINQVDDEIRVNVGSVARLWDANGNLSSETRDGVTTSYLRSARGDITQITRPRNLVSTFSSYFRGIPQGESHPELVSITRVVSPAGNVESERNGAGYTTAYSYDGVNRVTRIGPPRGNPTTISYTATTRTAARGKLIQTTTEDAFGRVANVTIDGIAMAYRHDSLGRKTFQSLSGNTGIGRTFTYDILDRLKSITHADNSSRLFTYGAATVAVRDERLYTTTYGYRAYGEPDQMFLLSVASPVAATNMTIGRNGRDQVTSVVQNGITRSFGYNSRFYLTSAIHPEVGATTYGRDDAGNMTSKTVGASGTTVYDYDGRNRLWRVTYPNGTPSQVVNTYTANDKLAAVSNAVAYRKYDYDANDNLIYEGINFAAGTGPVGGNGWIAATYYYNDNDQRASIVYPGLGRFGDYNTDYLGRVTRFAFGAAATPIVNASYWPNGQMYDIAFTGGSRATYGQNVREWLNSITVKTGDGVTRVSSAIAQDAAGNIASITDTVDTSYNRTFGYDEINRLTTASGPWGSGSMIYDGRGNITSQTLGPEQRTYTYDAQNRLATFSRTNYPANTYGYDVYGNALPSALSHTYDQASNLTSRFGQAFFYDGTNTRVKTVLGDVTTFEFRSAFGLLLAEWRQQPSFYDRLKEHVYISGKRVIEQSTDFLGTTQLTPTLMFLQPDASGSVVSSTWAGGGLLYKENYRPYGDQVSGAGNGFNKQWFAGQSQDATDLIYMGARYYNPLSGRFYSIDPKEVDPQDLHSFNRYSYANNNPNRFVDPDGNSPLDIGFLVYDLAKLGIAVYSGAGVGAAVADVALSAVGVLSPVPGTGQALKTLKVADKAIDAVRAVDHAVDAGKAAKATHPTFKPGSFAWESIPARGPARDFVAVERAEGKRIFNESGCHTCETKNAGTKKNDPVLDHQPVSSLNREGAPQRLYPQCLSCSREQGLAAARALREGAK